MLHYQYHAILYLTSSIHLISSQELLKHLCEINGQLSHYLVVMRSIWNQLVNHIVLVMYQFLNFGLTS